MVGVVQAVDQLAFCFKATAQTVMPSAAQSPGPDGNAPGRVAGPALRPFVLPGDAPVAHLRSMATTPNIKLEAKRLVDGLPDTASWDDLAYEVYVRQAIDAGIAQADAGRLVDHEDALARVRSRIRRVS